MSSHKSIGNAFRFLSKEWLKRTFILYFNHLIKFHKIWRIVLMNYIKEMNKFNKFNKLSGYKRNPQIKIASQFHLGHISDKFLLNFIIFSFYWWDNNRILLLNFERERVESNFQITPEYNRRKWKLIDFLCFRDNYL